MFLGLICRCKDEYFIEEFAKYYLKEGVDKIYIIDDNSEDKSIYNNILNSEKIDVIFEEKIISTKFVKKFYKSIKHKHEWIIYVDADEFITTKKNSDKSIREELQSTFKTAHCVLVPWVMMSCNSIHKSPKSILETNTYRWNHNLKHHREENKHKKFRCRSNEIEVKSIFKPAYFEDITDHHPINFNINPNIRVINSINNTRRRLNGLHQNLRENDINTGYLLCYHYRIISIENCVKKLKTNKWYIDNKYNLQDLMSNDYSEIADLTLHNKTID